MRRDSLPKKIRFEVFKRDSFTCQYCGAKAPDVVLEVDHIVPVSEGGTDELLNLVTACKACNAGKSDRKLSDNSILEKQRAQLEEFQERIEQIEMMLLWHKELTQLDDYILEQVADFWAQLVSPYRLNNAGRESLKKLLWKFGIDEVLEAMKVAVKQYVVYDEKRKPTHDSVEKAWSKVAGICLVRRTRDEKPYLQDILYIRGILRNRLSYVNERLALEILEECVRMGANIEELKEHATRVKNWTQWRTELEAFISKHAFGEGDDSIEKG